MEQPIQVPTEDSWSWDNTWTARLYEAFCCRHDRYQHANQALVEEAELQPGHQVLDFAAGTGRTAEAALPMVGERGRILCVEPARAMRTLGQARLTDSRITWLEACPQDNHLFDRILCGAAIWQVDSLAQTCQQLAEYLVSNGALSFNIPSLYLGQPDEPGGGRDPWLLALPAKLSQGHPALFEPGPPTTLAPLTVAQVEQHLKKVGLRPQRWSFRLRLTQEAYRDWLKIPILTNRLLAGLHPLERLECIDAAYGQCDPDSWRWESWTGWTAWKA